MKSWKTTAAGALAGIPPIIIGSAVAAHYTLSPLVTMILMSLAGAGTVMLGLVSKDVDVHSTIGEVQQASIQNVTKNESVKVDVTPSVKAN